ncbi:hypothetical protein GCM10010251_69890 [Streptomyces aurantiogriseus]|uniref:Uncharacterized protein n=1 Tax=Streptomyces aurantiogriseus TaxID=66870 RepID=A0A918FJD4_9ACTN|nr:hypothetical protein GCM10010251_69890 [Streptomyces aurantiogriseus]
MGTPRGSGRFGTPRRYPRGLEPITVSGRQTVERALGGLRTKERGYTRYGVTLVTEVTWFRIRGGRGRHL